MLLKKIRNKIKSVIYKKFWEIEFYAQRRRIMVCSTTITSKTKRIAIVGIIDWKETGQENV